MLAVGPSVLETRYQEEVIAFFLVTGMRYLAIVFPSSCHSQRLFVITSGFDDLFLWLTFFDIRYVPRRWY